VIRVRLDRESRELDSSAAALLPSALDSPAPFVVAHRAGNDLSRLRVAEALRVPLVEADVHLFAGRLEVRHLKTLGPVPILWDRWELAPPWRPRLLVEELLGARAPGTELMLDLKGHDRRLSARLADAIRASEAPERVSVCSRNWRLLEAFGDLDSVRVVHSVGSARQLARLRALRPGHALAGISIDRRLLNPAVVSELRHRARLLMAWPVETPEQARTLAGWGVHGLISQAFERLAPEFEIAW
jgi:glycerophosphoryl diester phosphodiesterase